MDGGQTMNLEGGRLPDRGCGLEEVKERVDRDARFMFRSRFKSCQSKTRQLGEQAKVEDRDVGLDTGT